MSNRSLRIAAFYFKSRLAIFFLQAVAYNVLPEHKSDAFNPPKSVADTYVDKILMRLLGGLERWDAKHFLFICESGYILENSLAFFPGYPLFVKLVSVIPRTVFPFNPGSAFLLSAVLINLFFGLGIVYLMYFLTFRITRSDRTSNLAASLFCINPATIFYVAPYTETSFFFLIISALLLLYGDKLILAAVAFSFASFIRSNGIVNIIFSFFLFFDIYTLKSPRVSAYVHLIIKFLLSTFIVSFPFFLFELYAFHQFCRSGSQVSMNYEFRKFCNAKQYLIVGTQLPLWCDHIISYSHVQQKYWNVGFFKYWKMKQIPNFILAFPALSVTLLCLYSFFKANLYIFSSKSICPQAIQMIIVHIHLAFLFLFALIFMNIQVATRFFFSASPMLYWHSSISIIKDCDNLALYYLDNLDFVSFYKHLIFHPIVIYFLLYTIIGTIAFSCGLPWT